MEKWSVLGSEWVEFVFDPGPNRIAYPYPVLRITDSLVLALIGL